MKIALYQMKILWEDKDGNFTKLKNILPQVQKEGVDLLVLPEMSFTGFSMRTERTKEEHEESKKRVQELCKEYKIAIGFGYAKAAKKKAENHFCIIGSSGNELLDYIKIHPFRMADEDQYFVKGDKLATCQIADKTLASFICYDLRFPDLFQALKDEVEVVIVSANWPKKRREHWKSLLQARAIENQVYVVGVNCVGTLDGLEYSGDSMIIHPNGEVLSHLDGKEGILYVSIDDEVKKVREGFPVRKDRQVELYQTFYNEL